MEYRITPAEQATISSIYLFSPNICFYTYRFYFDFSASFVGLGMIVPHVVNLGCFLGPSPLGDYYILSFEVKEGNGITPTILQV